MKQIPLTQGKFALVDDDVYEWAKDYKWHIRKKDHLCYAVRNFTDINGKHGKMSLHQAVIGSSIENLQIDHKDGNGLNDQRDNLRFVTVRQNGQNRYEHRSGQLVGAYFHKVVSRGKTYFYWETYIRVNGKQKNIGRFKTEREAHEAYLKALTLLGGRDND